MLEWLSGSRRLDKPVDRGAEIVDKGNRIGLIDLVLPEDEMGVPVLIAYLVLGLLLPLSFVVLAAELRCANDRVENFQVPPKFRVLRCQLVNLLVERFNFSDQGFDYQPLLLSEQLQ